MGVQLDVSTRSLQATVLRDQIDAGAGPGVLKVYSGTPPAHAGDALSGNTLLCQHTLSDPCGTVASGVLTFAAIAIDAAADATGTATFARIEDSDGNVRCQISAGGAGSGADLVFNDANLVAGVPVAITSLTITIGGA